MIRRWVARNLSASMLPLTIGRSLLLASLVALVVTYIDALD